MATEDIQYAVEDFWRRRDKQEGDLEDGGRSGGAARGNGHMKALEALVKGIFIDCGIPEDCVRTGQPYLPGYYRVRKQWDLVVEYKGVLVAAFEFKSQVGSVGKNFNNRFEEALGSATDIEAVQRKNEESPFGQVPPWLGYVFILEETPETEKEEDDAGPVPDRSRLPGPVVQPAVPGDDPAVHQGTRLRRRLVHHREARRW